MGLFAKYKPEEDVTRMGDAQIEAIAPVPENYVGDNIPYRGTVNHGVPVDEPFIDTDELMEEENPEPEYAPPVEEQEPVPVRIVQETDRERRYWRGNGYTVGTTPICVLSRNDRRRQAEIRNIIGTAGGSTTLHVSHTQEKVGWSMGNPQFDNVIIGSGGTPLVIHSTEPVWVSSDSDAEPTRVCVIEEFAVEE